MKKLLFASACVATVAAFGAGAAYNFTGFEGIDAGTGNIGLLTDNGAGTDSINSGFYWWYQDKESSTDGSTVKAYGIDDNLPIFDYRKLLPNEFATEGLANNNYLELSTEGGTLWRTAADRGTVPSIGAGVAMGELGTTDKVYVDTMVQFTPTEDGGTPAVEDEDKLAIWLNVETDENTGVATTNLCVLGSEMFAGAPQVHHITNAGEVKPGVWYRLTVKSIADITYGDSGFPGFQIWLDGKLLKSDKRAVDADDQMYEDIVFNSNGKFDVQGIKDGSYFGSLEGNNSSPVFMGVGFKGSGALDDLQIGEEDPNFLSAAGSLDFTLVWGEDISAVTYTINGGTAQTATSGTAIECESGDVVAITATSANPWYAVDADTVADLTVTEAGTKRTITATTLVATPADAGATGLGDVSTADAKAWADAKGLTPAAIAGKTWALNAYLMNTNLDAEPGLQITSITEVEGGWQITVKGTQGDTTVSLAGINGQLNIKAAATLEGLAEAEATPVNLTADQFDEAGVATITVTGDNKNFMKATVGVKAPAAE